MQATLYSQTGRPIGSIELDDYIFGIEPNIPVMHQMMVLQQANARQGTHSTRTRSEVQGSTRKIYPQKGTGRARQGAIRAPHHSGGGVVFGPKPRDYTKRMPKKMRRLAVRSALSAKQAAGELRFVDTFILDTIRTKAVVEMLNGFNLGKQKTLIVLADKNEVNDKLARSANNLPHVKTLNAMYLNIRDLLKYDVIMLPQASLEKINSWLGQSKKRELPADNVVSSRNEDVRTTIVAPPSSQKDQVQSSPATPNQEELLTQSDRPAGRFVNTWFEGEERLPPLRASHWYTFNLNIGAMRATPNKSSPFTEPRFGDSNELTLLVSLFSQDFELHEPLHQLKLPRVGDTSVIHTRAKPLHEGTCQLQIIIYVADELEVLQTLEVVVDVVADLTPVA